VPATATKAGTALAGVFGWTIEDGDAATLDRPVPSGERILGGVRRMGKATERTG
jgi:hypothetical protein